MKTILIILTSHLCMTNAGKLMALSGTSVQPASVALFFGKEDIKRPNENPRILKVPSEFPTIAAAIASSKEGDWILISPGTYAENEITIDKAITVSSEWKLAGDASKIDQTIIDAQDKTLFVITANDVEISGLKIINGDHTLSISARVRVSHNHFINNLDGMSFESGGGGYAGYNIAENDRDDALDSDIVADQENSGSDILIEHNIFTNSHDDGIEIRLFKQKNQNIHYTIRNNQIIASNNAGIQIISYDVYTGKSFDIHHNIFMNCKTGLGSMEGAKTREDLSGASKMDEQVFFYNNTISDCQMGATGGNNILAFNNLVSGNRLGGFKRFGSKSKIYQNLFFENGNDDLIEIAREVDKNGNIFLKDPLLDKNTFYPAEGSPCIDAGIADLEVGGTKVIKISAEDIYGKGPDIGAIESGLRKRGDHQENPLQAYAGEDRVIVSPATGLVLTGRTRNVSDILLSCSWKQEKGPSKAELLNSDQLVTAVNLNQEGIYQFSLNCSDGKSTASDLATIRIINQGTGKQLFLNEGKTNTIEAENFAYAYGSAKKVGKKYVGLAGNATDSGIAQMEFSVGMAEGGGYDLWFLMKSAGKGNDKIRVEFNQKNIGDVSAAEDKKFHWVKLPGRITATPGQWQLLIGNSNGKVLLDKIVFSMDPDFVPF